MDTLTFEKRYKPTVVLYHGNCFDGFTAAWVAKLRHPDAILIPCLHGAEIPDFPAAADVVMVDFSYSREIMDTLRKIITEAGGTFVVLDHHATAKAALDGFPGATFNLHKSGARLAWDYFFPLEPSVPPLVAYVEDRDLWRFALPFSREINALVEASVRTPASWDDLDQFIMHKRDDAVTLGAAILRAFETWVGIICNEVVFYAIAGLRVPTVNTSVQFAEVCQELLRRHPEATVTAYYVNRGDGFQQWGLRSRADVDCSALAKEFGGGGHPQAAGFQLSPAQQLATPFPRVS